MSARDSRNPREIEADIQRIRSRMNDTINAIENKLSPGQLIDQTFHYLRHNGAGEFASNLGTSVRQKPMPVALAGIGLGWLMMSGPGRHPSGATTGQGVSTPDLGHARAKMGSAKAQAGDLAGSAQDTAEGIAHGARERMARMKSGTRASAGSMSHQARQARSQFSYMMREQPLIMGALGIALGAALGASLAPTRREDELMGEVRDDMIDKAADVGQAQSEKLKSTAQAAKDAASEQAGQEGLKPEKDEERSTEARATQAQAQPGEAGKEPKSAGNDAGKPDSAPNRRM